MINIATQTEKGIPRMKGILSRVQKTAVRLGVIVATLNLPREEVRTWSPSINILKV